MGSLCSCLCNQSGHAGRCREIAESGLYLPDGEPRTRPIGVVCRPCYQAALRRRGEADTVPSGGELVGAARE